MSEENRMSEENKKTIISFIAGLLIGGLLVFIFSEPAMDNSMTDEHDHEHEETEMTEDEDELMDEEDNMVDEDEVPVVEDEEDNDTPAPLTGGSIEVEDQDAGGTVSLESVNYPVGGGWIGVRDYQNGQLGNILGVTRFNTTEGLLPSSIKLLRATTAGNTYAVVFYSDNGDNRFSLANDAQLSGVMETFEAE